jgi:hypothetical protein
VVPVLRAVEMPHGSVVAVGSGRAMAKHPEQSSLA